MIRQMFIVTAILFGLTTQVNAGVGGLFGITYTLGTSAANWGVTAKIISDNDANKGIVGAGVSFFPFAEENKFGADLSAGYLFENGAVTMGWDFLQWKPQLSLGYVNTVEDSKPATPVISPATPAPPSGDDET